MAIATVMITTTLTAKIYIYRLQCTLRVMALDLVIAVMLIAISSIL